MSLKFKRLPIPLDTHQIWGARAGRWTFIIGFNSDEGYTASYKDGPHSNTQHLNSLDMDDPAFSSFEAAKVACESVLLQTRLN